MKKIFAKGKETPTTITIVLVLCVLLFGLCFLSISAEAFAFNGLIQPYRHRTEN